MMEAGMFRRTAALAAATAIWLFAATAGAGIVTDGDDTGASGQLRQELGSASASDAIGFASSVTTVTITDSAAINVAVTGLTIKGNTDASGGPATTITTSGSRTSPILLSTQNAGSGLTLENLAFKDIKFQYTGEFRGGGIVSAYSQALDDATLGNLSNVRFTGNTTSVTQLILGGGLVGAHSQGSTASLGAVSGTFGAVGGGNTMTAGTYIQGGGLVGAAASADARLGAVSGAFGTAGGGNTVTAGTNINGGGLVGAYAHFGNASIGIVSGTFLDNIITAGNYLAGGGVLGAYAPGFSSNASLGGFNEASFTNNKIEAGGQAAVNEGWAMGGVIGASGLDSAWTITDTTVTGNSLTVRNHNPAVTSGTVYIGTDRDSTNSSHAVTVTGNSSFSGNTVSYSGGPARANSFHFGREWYGWSNTLRDSLADASLTLAPGAGETVALLDPISVDMNNGKKFVYTVAATAADGRVELDGLSRLDAAGGATFTAEAGVLALGSSFSLAAGATTAGGGAAVNGGAFEVSLDNSGGQLSLEFDLDGRDGTLAMFANPDSFTVTDGPEATFVTVSNRTFSTETTYGQWLVTDNRGTVDETVFSLADPASKLEFLTEGDNLYISGITSATPTSVSQNHSPNVRLSFQSGALNAAWLAAKTEMSGRPQTEINAMFDRIAANPRGLTAEVFASRGLAALDSSRDMWRGVKGLAGLGLPGGWQWGESFAPSAGSETGAGPTLWAGSFASRSERDDRGGLGGYDGRLYGAALGADYAFDQTWKAGLYLAYARDKSDFDSLGADIEADGWQLGGYLEARPTSRWGLRLDLSQTWFDNDLKHHGPAGRYQADFKQRVFGLGLETAYDFYPTEATRLSPFAGLRWQHLSQDRGRERAQGGVPQALASSLSSLSADSLASSLGAEIMHDIPLADGRWLRPSFRAAWSHEFGDDQLRGRGAYGGSNGTYRVVSLERSRDTADLAANLTTRMHQSADGGGLDLSLGAEASLGSGYHSYGFRLGLGVEY